MFESGRNVPVSTVVSAALWVAGAALVCLQLGFEVADVGDGHWAGLGTAGLFAGMAGATLTVRGYFCRFARGQSQREAELERNAFDVGFDAGQRGSSVRPLR